MVYTAAEYVSAEQVFAANRAGIILIVHQAPSWMHLALCSVDQADFFTLPSLLPHWMPFWASNVLVLEYVSYVLGA